MSDTVILGFDRVDESEVRKLVESQRELGTTFSVYQEIASHRSVLDHGDVPAELIVLATGLPAGVMSLIRLWLGRGKRVSVERNGVRVELVNHSAREAADLLRSVGLQDDSEDPSS